MKCDATTKYVASGFIPDVIWTAKDAKGTVLARQALREAERLVKGWLKKAGAPPKKAWKEGTPAMDISYRETYAMNPQQG